MATWCTTPPRARNTRSPGWRFCLATAVPARAWSWASRGSITPWTLNTLYTRPEQSNPNPEVPAHKYLTPKNSRALATTSAAAGRSADVPVGVIVTAVRGASSISPPGRPSRTIAVPWWTTGSLVPKLASTTGTPPRSSHVVGSVTVATEPDAGGPSALNWPTGIQPG